MHALAVKGRGVLLRAGLMAGADLDDILKPAPHAQPEVEPETGRALLVSATIGDRLTIALEYAPLDGVFTISGTGRTAVATDDFPIAMQVWFDAAVVGIVEARAAEAALHD